MQHHPAVSAGKMEVAPCPVMKTDVMQMIAEMSYVAPDLVRFGMSFYARFRLPLMGVNKQCRRIMSRIVAEKWPAVLRMFDEYLIDFVRIYMWPTVGWNPALKCSLWYYMRDGTRYEVESAIFWRRDRFWFNEEEEMTTSVLSVAHGLEFTNAGRRWSKIWNISFDGSNGFNVVPSLRSQEQSEDVQRTIGIIQAEMRRVLEHPDETMRARSDYEGSDLSYLEDFKSEISGFSIENPSINSDEMLEGQLDVESPGSDDKIEALHDEAEELWANGFA
jgi:hypothetical protein